MLDRGAPPGGGGRAASVQPLARVELTNAIHLNHGRRGHITAADVRAVTVQINEDVEAQRLRTTAVDLAGAFRNATRLAREQSARVLCRRLDVLHVCRDAGASL